MAFFRVGMRVRMVHSITGRVPVGTQGTVTSIIPGKRVKEGYVAEIGVRFDGFPIELSSRIFCKAEQLEPILNDGDRACDTEFKQSLDQLLSRTRQEA